MEAKFASPFFDRDKIFQTYYPQVAMQMHCTDADCAILVVAQGTNDPFEIECVRSSAYEAVMLSEAAAMLESMDMLHPPVAIETPVMVPPEKWRTIDLAVDHPNWGEELIQHLLGYENTRDAAEAHEFCGRSAKQLIPDDVGKVLTSTHIIARNKRNALSITQRKT